jgi:two-component system, NarL family, nitrate/nitrite response regulator NarL
MTEAIRIVLVDDHPLFRDGVASTLQADPDFEVVGQGASAAEAVRLAQDLLPDMIVLDIDMPGSGLNAVRSSRRPARPSRSSCSPSPSRKTTCCTRSS